MAHLWLRHETRANEARAALTPEGAATLLALGHTVTVEDSPTRIFPTAAYGAAGCRIVPPETWPEAPPEALILGLKELPDDDRPLSHRHIMFGHAYKGQLSGTRLLARFRKGGGTLLDLEYLEDETGRRVAAFGYWAGFAGAGVTLLALAAQRAGGICGPVTTYPSAEAMVDAVSATGPATALIIGAKGRVGAGAADLLSRVGIAPTLWDMEETAHGGPFPEILAHDLFFNCILAQPGTPVFVARDTPTQPRALRVIGDIACDPDSDYNPVPLYTEATTWNAPVHRVHDSPPLDIMAIDNLPSLLPKESAEDFAAQLLPHLTVIDTDPTGVWKRAKATFDRAMAT